MAKKKLTKEEQLLNDNRALQRRLSICNERSKAHLDKVGALADLVNTLAHVLERIAANECYSMECEISGPGNAEIAQEALDAIKRHTG